MRTEVAVRGAVVLLGEAEEFSDGGASLLDCATLAIGKQVVQASRGRIRRQKRLTLRLSARDGLLSDNFVAKSSKVIPQALLRVVFQP